MKKSQLSPHEARTDKQICSLRSDNVDAPEGWMMIDEGVVTLCNQRSGEHSTGTVQFTRRSFKKFADWYLKPQPVRTKE